MKPLSVENRCDDCVVYFEEEERPDFWSTRPKPVCAVASSVCFGLAYFIGSSLVPPDDHIISGRLLGEASAFGLGFLGVVLLIAGFIRIEKHFWLPIASAAALALSFLLVR